MYLIWLTTRKNDISDSDTLLICIVTCIYIQWPGSYCDTKRSCCYPTTGKPDEDFSIHGLWPNYITGKWPQNCILNDTLDVSQVILLLCICIYMYIIKQSLLVVTLINWMHAQISDLLSTLQKDWPTLACPSADGIKFWGHEWEKHGTCSSLDQHSYFQATLDLKHRSNLLQVLANAGTILYILLIEIWDQAIYI